MLKDLFSLLKKDDKIPEYDHVERKIDEEFVQVATRIKSGQYEGVIFSVGGVSMTEEGEEIKLNYQYRIEHLPEGMDVSKIDTTIGDIIMDVIQKDVESKEE